MTTIHPNSTRRAVLQSSSALFLSAAWNLALGQSHSGYPSRPVKLLIGFPPGGPVDVIGRLLADQLGRQLKQAFVVENRSGAGGAIAADVLAKAAPDGLTLGIAPISSFAIAPAAGLKIGYRVPDDFSFISMLVKLGGVILARPNAPFHDLPSLIAAAKAVPDKLVYASSGLGTSSHLSAEYLSQRAGIRMVHVPYKGTTPAVQDLLGGQVDMLFETSQVAAAPLVAAGKLKALALTSGTRSALLPGVRTVAEQGFPGFDVSPWMGLVGPSQLAPAIVELLQSAVVRGMGEPQVEERVTALGGTVETNTPQAFRQFVIQDIARWSELIQRAGIKIE